MVLEPLCVVIIAGVALGCGMQDMAGGVWAGGGAGCSSRILEKDDGPGFLGQDFETGFLGQDFGAGQWSWIFGAG